VTELWRSRPAGYTVAVAVPLVATVAGAQLAMPAFIFEHLMVVAVVALAIVSGRGPATVAAIVGVAGDNILLREPIGRPVITGVRDVIDFGLFLGVAIVVGWLVDRVQRARAEAVAAAERERMAREDLDRLVATITHDLATPLGAIQGTIQFARKHAALSDVDVSRLLSRVETAAARATSLIRALADAKSIEQQSFSLQSRPLDLREVVEPLVSMLDRLSDRHPIALAMDAGPILINGDADRLGRVIENLITNAVKYSPDGGAVEVYVGRRDGTAVLTVRDHGMGMPDEARERVFELGYRTPGAQRAAPGLGLGLYTAAEVVRRHGGTIAAAPANDAGTLFTVTLPLLASSRVS
jgi:signal transduction histidine kinase